MCVSFIIHIFVSYFTKKYYMYVGSPSTRPVPDTTEWDFQMKKDWIFKETQVFLNEIFQRTSVPENVAILDETHRKGFPCRQAECGMQFPLHSTRVRY